MSAKWTFLSNHGHVLVALANDPTSRLKDVAEAVGITERAVHLILTDLVTEGVVHRRREGRRNVYELNRGAHFRHALEASVTVGAFVDLVCTS